MSINRAYQLRQKENGKKGLGKQVFHLDLITEECFAGLISLERVLPPGGSSLRMVCFRMKAKLFQGRVGSCVCQVLQIDHGIRIVSFPNHQGSAATGRREWAPI